jgi:hypothetical protein
VRRKGIGRWVGTRDGTRCFIGKSRRIALARLD